MAVLKFLTPFEVNETRYVSPKVRELAARKRSPGRVLCKFNGDINRS